VEVPSDEEILEFIQGQNGSLFHASCTCKMGRANDAMAVVDSRARLFGVGSLRVVDASSFLLLSPGHPTSAICKWSFFSGGVLKG